MAIDVFWYYTATLTFSCVITALLLLYRYYLGNRLIEQSTKLKSQIAKIRQDYPQIGRPPDEMVADSLEGLGVDGIINSLGLPKFVTPFIKGFLSNPKNVEKIMEILKSKGINIPGVDTTQNTQEGVPLL